MTGAQGIDPIAFVELRQAATDRSRVGGLTHQFYRYPARFSPQFAAKAIELFSKPGDIVLDPYMGGGTTIVEALAAGRLALGNDLNELSRFLVEVKTRPLSKEQFTEIRRWVNRALPKMHFRFDRSKIQHLLDTPQTHNLSLPSARPFKKAVAGALLALNGIKSRNAKAFARCVLLRLGQWQLDSRKTTPSLDEVREKFRGLTEEMLQASQDFGDAIADNKRPTLLCVDASQLHLHPLFTNRKVDLVVTSPPYPGVHVLYHRWQINGRRETPAPYWLSNTNDGRGAAFYNFADRRGTGLAKYFEVALQTLKSINAVMKKGSLMVQMVAFSDPNDHLQQYLEMLEEAGFSEIPDPAGDQQRIWRTVPNRKWHAATKGKTKASREVVLIHRAI